MKTLGVLLPRDFLERQPERWKRSQHKRGATKLLRRMQAKHEKRIEKTMQNVRNDAQLTEEKNGGKKPEAAIARAAAPAPAPASTPAAAAATGSTSTGFGPLVRGFWGAVLAPNKPLVITIPPGAHLCLLHAALAADAPAPGKAATDPAVVAVRCRTPSTKTPTTVCYLQHAATGAAGAPAPSHPDACQLQLMFTPAKDGRLAVAAEGTHAVHLVGVYSREQPVSEDEAAAEPAASGAAARTQSAEAAAPAAAAKAAPAAAPKPAASAPAPAAAKQAAGIREMESGLKVVDTAIGRGRAAKSGDKLSVRYSGLTADAKGSWFQVRRRLQMRRVLLALRGGGGRAPRAPYSPVASPTCARRPAPSP